MRQLPHCDAAILHAPGECEYCDHSPDWQEYRMMARINFTGHNDADKAPCPSVWFRAPEIRDLWYGNVPKPSDE